MKKKILKKSLAGTAGKNLKKYFFRPNVSCRTSVDAFFDGDYEFDIVCGEICSQKINIAKHEPVLA